MPDNQHWKDQYHFSNYYLYLCSDLSSAVLSDLHFGTTLHRSFIAFQLIGPLWEGAAPAAWQSSFLLLAEAWLLQAFSVSSCLPILVSLRYLSPFCLCSRRRSISSVQASHPCLHCLLCWIGVTCYAPDFPWLFVLASYASPLDWQNDDHLSAQMTAPAWLVKASSIWKTVPLELSGSYSLWNYCPPSSHEFCLAQSVRQAWSFVANCCLRIGVAFSQWNLGGSFAWLETWRQNSLPFLPLCSTVAPIHSRYPVRSYQSQIAGTWATADLVQLSQVDCLVPCPSSFSPLSLHSDRATAWFAMCQTSLRSVYCCWDHSPHPPGYWTGCCSWNLCSPDYPPSTAWIDLRLHLVSSTWTGSASVLSVPETVSPP